MTTYMAEDIQPATLPAWKKALKRKLQMLKAAVTINDLRIPPSNHLELLKGKLAGYYSIRVNAQYRLIFHWSQQQQEAYDVHH